MSLPIFPGIIDDAGRSRGRRREARTSVADGPCNDAPCRLIDDVAFGEGVVVHSFTNLYGCRIGDHTRIGTFVEVQRGVVIGANCKVQSHTFVCEGVTIEDEVFVGHGVMFVNDKRPRATAGGVLQGARRLDDADHRRRTRCVDR